jgi:glycine betaine catabolism A
MPSFKTAAEIGTGGAKTLERRYFVSNEVFADEQDRIFRRHWICAGRAELIPEGGDYFLRSFGGESVIVLRDAGGEVRGFHNVCRHRGTRLCNSTTGRFGKSIQCPYHAWTYALDGSLIGAPGMEELLGFDRSQYPLHPVDVAPPGRPSNLRFSMTESRGRVQFVTASRHA